MIISTIYKNYYELKSLTQTSRNKDVVKVFYADAYKYLLYFYIFYSHTL